MKRVQLVVIVGVFALVGGGAVGLYYQRSKGPPGDWMPTATLKEREAAARKEGQWAECKLTAIEDADAFRKALAAIPLRVETAVSPEEVGALRDILFQQLIARHLGSLDAYKDTFGRNRRPIIDERNRDWLARKHMLRFDEELAPAASAEAVFERFWRAEYQSQDGERRFEAVCLKEGGALIVIGEVHTADLLTFLTPKEQQRWFTWPGARRLHSAEMYLPARSLDSVLQDSARCKQAEVLLVIKSRNGDVWCWMTHWNLAPNSVDWGIRGSWAVCSRRKYDVPI
jgi:hypothetical protein